MFIIFFILAFIIGILIGMPTAPYASPQSVQVIIIILSPFVLLYFFTEIPLMNTIRYLYLGLAIGIFSYWTYFQSRQQG